MNDEQYELLKKNVKKWNEYYRINGRHEANLTDANLRGSDLAGADLRRALLTGANLESAGFELRFDKRVTPEQVKVTLAALADYFRNCGGVGFVIDSDLQMLITEPRHAGVH